MAGRQGTLGWWGGRVQNIGEVGKTARMNVLSLVWILVRVRMLHHASSGLRFQDDPGTIAFFQIVSDLHARTRGGSGLRAEFDLGVGLIAVDGKAADIHLHGADVERANGGQMLQDAGADGVSVIRLVLASTDMEKGGEKQYGCGRSFHKQFHLSHLQSIAHEKGDANMENGEDRKGVTKGPVDDVPELKDALRSAKEGDALGQRGLLLRQANGALESRVAGGEKAEAGKYPRAEARFTKAQQRSLKGALDVEQKHGK